MEKSAQPGFNPRLESLRGIAALGVVVTHCFGAFRVDGLPAYFLIPFPQQPAGAKTLTVLGSLLNPDGAVVLFFILSGYVLSLSFLRSRASLSGQLGRYLIRRLFRLLPAMWLSIWLMAIVRHLLSNAVPISAQTIFFFGMFHRWIDLGAILRNCALIDFRVNPITWTMYVEVIGSLFIPLMIAVAQKGRLLGFAFLLVLILAAWWPHAGLHDARNYLFCFQAGVLLACYPDLVRKLPVWPPALFGAGYILLIIQRMASIDHFPGNLLLAVGASMLLAAVAPAAATFRWLDHAPIRFFGPHILQPVSATLDGLVRACAGLRRPRHLAEIRRHGCDPVAYHRHNLFHGCPCLAILHLRRAPLYPAGKDIVFRMRCPLQSGKTDTVVAGTDL